ALRQTLLGDPKDENGDAEAESDEADQHDAESSDRDHRKPARQHPPGKGNQRGLRAEGPIGRRLQTQQAADSSVKASPETSSLGGFDTDPPSANHLVRL